MMQVSRAKRVVAAVLALVAVTGLVALLLIAGLVVLSTGTGADPAEAFLEIPTVPESLEELVTWQPDPPLIREVEPDTRTLIESTWVRSWQRVDTAERTATRELIDTWYLPNLAPHVARDDDSNRAAAISQLGHTFQVTFYSLDGSILAINIDSFLERRVEDGPSLRSAERYEVVFLLSDGNWRIQHLVLLEAENA